MMITASHLLAVAIGAALAGLVGLMARLFISPILFTRFVAQCANIMRLIAPPVDWMQKWHVGESSTQVYQNINESDTAVNFIGTLFFATFTDASDNVRYDVVGFRSR